MAAEIHPPSEIAEAPKKRKFKYKKLIDPKKKKKMKTKKGMEASRRENPRPKVRNSKKMTKLFQKRAREYNSDEDEEENDELLGPRIQWLSMEKRDGLGIPAKGKEQVIWTREMEKKKKVKEVLKMKEMKFSPESPSLLKGVERFGSLS